jgi:type II secretory pathway component PulJ
MSSEHTIGNEVLADVQADEQREDAVAERPELRATVELETQAKVDTNHPDARPEGMTLEAQERMEARESEIERMNERADFRQVSSREARTRRVATEGSRERRRAVHVRAASVDPTRSPDWEDPRARLSQAELADVNQEADRLASKLDCWKRPAIARQLAEEIVAGASMTVASIRVVEQAKTSPGTVVPIAKIGEVPSEEVNVEGTITQLWTPSSPAIAQVGLLEEESGRVKITSWVKSDPPRVEEGERVRIYKAAKSWYDGRVHIAATGWTEMTFPDREAWWTE